MIFGGGGGRFIFYRENRIFCMKINYIDKLEIVYRYFKIKFI